MKRAIILLMAVLLYGAAQSQTVTSFYKAFAGTTADTIYASETKTYTLDLGNAGGWAGKVYDYSVQVFLDYTSGTTTGYVKVWEGIDGTNYPATATDSLLVTSAADRSYYFQGNSKTARYVKVSWIPTSATQVGRIYGYISVGKHY